jgi:TRAP-type C4-dicarboxylate transport system substrate-binding protein
MLSLGPTVIAILMNRKKLESLSKENQAVIRQYSGEWLAARIVEGYAPYNKEIVEQLKSDPARAVVFPSQADIDVAAMLLMSSAAEARIKECIFMVASFGTPRDRQRI